MGELLTFTPRPARSNAIACGLPGTIVIFPGVRYDRAGRMDAVPALQRQAEPHGDMPEKVKS